MTEKKPWKGVGRYWKHETGTNSYTEETVEKKTYIYIQM